MIFDHCSKRYHWSVTGHSEAPFVRCLPVRQEIVNVSQIAVTLNKNAPTILQSDWTAIAPQTYLLSLCELLFEQSHLFPICVVLTYNDSRIIPRKTCQIPRNCQCKRLLVSLLAPRTFVSSFVFSEKFSFFTRVRLYPLSCQI